MKNNLCNIRVFFISILIYACCITYSKAQGPLCVGSTSVPVVLETFGAGPNPGPPLNGLTNYIYVAGYPPDGRYTISNTTSFTGNPGPGYWQTSGDHTGDPNGYMMVVNADYAAGEFYRKKITGLCPNTTYIFSTYAANVNTDSLRSYCNPPLYPNILFKIEDPNGVVLGSQSSGDIPIDKGKLVWREYGFRFSSKTHTSVSIVMVNNGTGGCGNDLVIDDVSFYICNPIIDPKTNPSKPAYCTGDSVTIMGGLGPGYTNPQFQWQFSGDAGVTWTDMPGDTNLNLSLKNLTILSMPGQYRLIASERGNIGSGTCRITSPPVTIIVVPHPSVNITSTNVSCFGGNDGSANAIPSGGNQPYYYLWSTTPPGTTPGISGLIPGIYSVTVTDKYGCSNQSSVNITQASSLIINSALHTDVSCYGGSNGSASVNISGGTPAYTYQWSNNATTSAITGISAGTYSVLITDAKGCASSTQTFTITQPTELTLSISGDDSICKTDISVLKASPSGGTPAYTYLWMPVNQNTPSISVTPTSPTTYTATTTDAHGCLLEKTFSIYIYPDPIALFDTIASGFYNSTYTYKDLSTGAISWLWDFNDGNTSTDQNPTHRFPGVGIYNVSQMVTNKYGCRDTFILPIYCYEQILIPNIFTPDGDNSNDEWYVPNSGMQEFHVEIYDRWGIKVFETTSDKARWDGKTNDGKELSEGVYFFVLKAIVKSIGRTKDYSTQGHITLLRGRNK